MLQANTLKTKKILAETSSINKKFQTNQKQVFCEWKNKKTEIKETKLKFSSEIYGEKIKNITKMRNGFRDYIKNTAKMLNQNRTKLLQKLLRKYYLA